MQEMLQNCHINLRIIYISLQTLVTMRYTTDERGILNNVLHQLEVNERMRSNLITIVGYELWTPLSTIQVGLESLAGSPAGSLESRQVLLDIAMADLERLRQLIQDFLTLSRLESSQLYHRRESLQLREALEIVLKRTLLRMLHNGEPAPRLGLPPQSAQTDSRATQAEPAALLHQLEVNEHTRSNLIAIVGHELRTPLSTIQVCLESLASSPAGPTESRQAMLEMAMADLERLRQLIQDFFILSRLECGQVYHRPEFVQLRDVLENVLSSLRNSRSQESLPELFVELPPQLPAIRADGDRLIEALTKLLDNACKFTEPSGKVTIWAGIRRREVNPAPGSSLMLEVIVADTGRGIAPSHLEAIFNDFYQEEGARRRTVGGTGIGLAICRQIIHSLGGQIWADSAGPKQGSQFHFTVPVVGNG